MDTHLPTDHSQKVNASKLATALRKEVAGEVRFDDGSRALYATDASNYRQAPIGVVLPKTEEDIVRTMALCRRFGAPVLTRGGGTSLAGQCCNVAVVLDLSKYYHRILAFDREKKWVTVQTGLVLDDLRKVTEAQGLTVGPDPATHSHCTIGGMLGNNSCGVHSVLSANYGYGARMSDNVESMKVLTYDGSVLEVGPTSPDLLDSFIRQGGRRGEIYQLLNELIHKYGDLIRARFPRIPRRVSGYNLDDLLPENGFNVAKALVGTEGTCVSVLEATIKLVPDPAHRLLMVLGYPDIYSAGRHVPGILEHKPIGLEGIDRKLIGYMKKTGLNTEDLSLLPEGKGWLMVEFGAESKKQAEEQAARLKAYLQQQEGSPDISLFEDAHEEQMIWEIRESGLGATAFVPDMDDTWPGWEDSAVPPAKIGSYLQDLRALFDKYGYEAALYGHLGQGCVHCRINFDLRSAEGIEQYRRFTAEAADLVLDYGGSLSGEHGDGQARADLLEKMYGTELMEAFREFKAIWDPAGRMNPGKVVRPFSRTENLRLREQYPSKEPDTFFRFPDDQGQFSRAAMRCVGVGKCRRKEEGTMCPSYQVTMEEKHSTRGRARLLFEMMEGGIIPGSWDNEAAKEALDLCLSCKGCKGECPVSVDMATYKAEFLAHYYQHHRRPAEAHFFGKIDRVARLATRLPGLANFFTQTPGLSALVKRLGGISPERALPRFARQNFVRWWRKNRPDPAAGRDRPRVLLWADTFHNYFLPDILKAGAAVLAEAGYEVLVPDQPLCCGRPLYDFGMLETALRRLQHILEVLRREIEEGVPLVVLEPSCWSVFRDELINLFPNDERARRLQGSTYTLAEFLAVKAEGYVPPALEGKALLHGHCHQKALGDLKHEQTLLTRMGLETACPDTGCCGMAGPFGYGRGRRHEVSVQAGERVLLPAVREAGEATYLLTDGFSCREQIVQQTGRRPLHFAEMLRHAGRLQISFEELPNPRS